MANRGRPAAIQDDEDPEEQTQSMFVDGATAPGDETIHIDARTGQVRRQNQDGSLSILDPTPKRKPRGDRTFNDNLAEQMPDWVLARISMRLMEAIDADIQSRRDWIETGERGADLIGVKLEEASAEISPEGMISKVKHTGLLQACLNSWASSRAELLPVGGPVKVRDDEDTEEQEEDAAAGGIMGGGIPEGADMTNVVPLPPVGGAGPGINGVMPPAGQPQNQQMRNKLAEALQRDMNHYLTVTDKDYYPDTSRMLMSRALMGAQFKKVYHDPLLRRPVSRWVRGSNLIVSNEATSLAGAARVTEEIPMRQGAVKRMQRMGMWRDIPLVIPTTSPNSMDRKIKETEGIDPLQRLPADQLHTIYECCTELGENDAEMLAEDERGRYLGFPLAYRVTIDKDSRQVLEIRRNWKKNDPLFTKRRRYVKFGLVPGLGFYDWGFVHLIGNPQRGATMIQRCLTDTGMLNSFPGGVIAKGPTSRQRTTEIRPGLGEFVVIDTGGKPVTDFVTTWPYKEPSAVLQAMGQDIASQMKQVAGVVDLPVGEGRIGNTPVGTIMAYVDAVTKVPSAVHKDDHIAQQEEFELLKELFAEDPASLWQGRKKPARRWNSAAEIEDQDLVPAADPNVPSQTHRLMQTSMLVQMAGMPQFAGIPNQRAIWETALSTMGWSNTGEYTMPQQAAAPPPPDPKLVIQQMKSKDAADDRVSKAALEQQKHEAKVEETKIESADKDADRQSQDFRAALKANTDKDNMHAGILQHGAGIVAGHAKHLDTINHARAELIQDHVQHKETLEHQAGQGPFPAPIAPAFGTGDDSTPQ